MFGKMIRSHGGGPPASFVFNGTDERLEAAIVSSSPNRQSFTISLWLKWLSSGGEPGFFGSGLSNSNLFECFGGDLVGVQRYALYEKETNVVRAEYYTGDQNFALNSWEHLVYAFGTTSAVAGQRFLFYRNNVSVTPSATTTIPQNTSLRFMVNGDELLVGSSHVGGPINAKIAFVQVVEGLRLTPSEFVVNDGGVLKHKKYGGNFGAHGFYLSGNNGFSDVHRSLAFTPINMDASNLDFADVPPFVTV